MLSPSQAARVAAGIEGEYRREEQREQRAMDSKTIPQLAHKQQLSPVFFTAFTAATEEAAKIGKAVGTGDYPGLDAVWHLYTSPSSRADEGPRVCPFCPAVAVPSQALILSFRQRRKKKEKKNATLNNSPPGFRHRK
jgi:hypothetical protein